MIAFNILLIAIFVVCVTDISQFFTQIEEYIARWLNLKQVHIKLLECSLCQTWWLSVIYLIYTQNFNLSNIVIAILISCFTTQIKDLIIFFQDIITTIIKTLYDNFIK